MIIPIALGVVVLSGLAWAYRKSIASAASSLPTSAAKSSISKGLISRQAPSPSDMVQVKLGNDTWLVARDYIGPIGIGEAADFAKSVGMQLPPPALVDAIWRQADLKLTPMPRNNVVSQAVFDDQVQKIQVQIDGRPFTLMGGAFKDVVIQSDNFPGLYGWHVSDEDAPAFSKKFGIPLNKPVTPGPGKPIQPLSGHAHGLFFKDYSQGLRLVKKMG